MNELTDIILKFFLSFVASLVAGWVVAMIQSVMKKLHRETQKKDLELLKELAEIAVMRVRYEIPLSQRNPSDGKRVGLAELKWLDALCEDWGLRVSTRTKHAVLSAVKEEICHRMKST